PHKSELYSPNVSGVSATQAVLANRRRGCGAIWGGYGVRLRKPILLLS
ncbi:uncharacterized protein METZ01_LOCUS264411, partial [marine metagenome]